MLKKKELVIATKNRGKVREIRHALKSLKLKVLSLLDEPGIPAVKETGRTFEENAVKKAKAVAKRFSALALADDSGLQVDALKGLPGIRSARFAGPKPTTEKLCGKLLRVMKGKVNRKARFVCVIAVADGKKVRTVKGVCGGRIIDRMKGKNGFGYDPVFMPNGYGRTFAQMPLNLKNRISHRGKALRKARKLLRKFL